MANETSPLTNLSAISELPDMLWDVIIVGAGPAGSATAAQLAHNGHGVLLLDRHRFPREKVCGDFLFTDVLDYLRRIGCFESVARNALRVEKIRVYSPSGLPVDVPGDFLLLKRERFDELMLQYAVNSGARFAVAKVTGVGSVGEFQTEIRIESQPTALRGRISILATGADVTIAARAGMIRHKPPTAVATRCYVRSDYHLDHAVLSYDRSLLPGYAWIMPVGNNEYNVGCGAHYPDIQRGAANLKTTFEHYITDFPVARQIMEQQQSMTRLRGAPLRCDLESSASYMRGSIVAIGETIGTTLPFTGEGVGTAIHCGEMAAAAVSRALKTNNLAELHEYPRQLRRHMLNRHRSYSRAEKWMTRRLLNDFLAWRLGRSSYLRSQLQEFLVRTGNARSVYSPSQIIRSFFQ